MLVIDLEGVPRVPSSDTVIRADDQIVAVTREENEDSLRAALISPARLGPIGSATP